MAELTTSATVTTAMTVSCSFFICGSCIFSAKLILSSFLSLGERVYSFLLAEFLVKKNVGKVFFLETTYYFTVSGMAVVRKAFSAIAFISMLLLSAVASTQLVNSVSANPLPHKYGYVVSPDNSTEPPTITITNTTLNGNNVTINYNAKVGESATAYTTHIDNVSYTSDWNQNKIYVYRDYDPAHEEWGSQGQQKEISYAAEITNIPEGDHILKMYVDERGSYIIDERLCPFYITKSATVNFTVDTLPPTVTVLSLENMTYDLSDVPLSFSVNEAASISYVLDCQDEVLVDGNTTLIGLSNGLHRVTVYAVDVKGNVGVSETITFTIDAFPVAPVAVASMALIGLGLLVYFKKRKH